MVQVHHEVDLATVNKPNCREQLRDLFHNLDSPRPEGGGELEAQAVKETRPEVLGGTLKMPCHHSTACGFYRRSNNPLPYGQDGNGIAAHLSEQ